ncbi:MAG: HlyC/CorC family transporter [Chloroflexi bacterium]|nr:HlyC/CorC family transporter [Chloroflexota bacterium]
MEGLPLAGSDLTVNLVIIVISLILVAFFTSSEVNLISVSRMRVRHLAEQGNRSAQAVLRVIGNEENFFATVVLGQDLFIILATAASTALAITLVGEGAVPLATAVMTVVVLLFGEMLPKVAAMQRREAFALVVARPMEFTMTVMRPLTAVFAALSRLVTRVVRGSRVEEPSVTEGELRMLVDIGEAEGTVEEAAAEIIQNVFDFGTRTAREVMLPRPQIIEVEQDTPLPDFLNLFLQSPHSRYPVFEESIDNIVGILSIREIFQSYARGELREDETIRRFVLPAYFVPETKRISDLLKELQETGNLMVIVVDEFGGTAGLVTLDQLVEEIVGQVQTEAAGAREIQVIDEKTREIDGSMRIEEANEELGLNLPKGAYETVAGFILSDLGRIPKQGEQLKYADLKFVVAEMKGLKIERILVSKV